MKKLMIVAFALVLGGRAAQAADLVSLGIYYRGSGSVELVEQTPKVAYRSKNVPGKDGWTSFPCYISIDSPKSVELKFKVSGGDVTFYASLYAFQKGGGKLVPLLCSKFEYNGKPVPGVPCVVNGWKRMLTRKLKDGDTFTITVDMEKQED